MTAGPGSVRLPFPVRALRRVALLEGCSFVLLLVGSAMKRTSSFDVVPVLGPVHGTLFLLLVGLVLLSWPWLRWRPVFLLLVVTVLSPGAHFAVRATVEQRAARHSGRAPAGARPDRG